MLKKKLDERKDLSDLTKRTPGECPEADAREEEESAKMRQEEENAEMVFTGTFGKFVNL